jgi:hypothetical protein
MIHSSVFRGYEISVFIDLSGGSKNNLGTTKIS